MNTRLLAMMVAVFAGLSLALPPPSRADDDDHDQARELYEHGEIHPLLEILRQVRAEVPGDVVGIDLVRAGQRWVYRLQVVAPDGRRSIVDVDAGAATIMDDDDDEHDGR